MIKLLCKKLLNYNLCMVFEIENICVVIINHHLTINSKNFIRITKKIKNQKIKKPLLFIEIKMKDHHREGEDNTELYDHCLFFYYLLPSLIISSSSFIYRREIF